MMMEAAASCWCLYREVSVAGGGKASSYSFPSTATVIIPTHPRRRIVLSQLGPTKKTPRANPKASPALSPAPPSTSSSPKRRKKKKVRDRRQHQQQQDESSEQCVLPAEEAISVQTLYQNGDPLGRKELGKCGIRWISQGMRAMASDFASAERASSPSSGSASALGSPIPLLLLRPLGALFL